MKRLIRRTSNARSRAGAYTNRILTIEGNGCDCNGCFLLQFLLSACQDTTGGGGDGPFDVTFNVNMANEDS